VSVAEATGTVRGERRLWPALVSLQARYPLLQAIAVIVAFTIGAIPLPGLAEWPSVKVILVLSALAGIAGIGQTLLILMGGFDLSIPGIIVATGLIVTVIAGGWGISFVPALLVALVFAGTLGAISGQISHRFNIQPLVVTLATGAIAAGLAQTQTREGIFGAGAPQWLVDISSPAGRTFGIDIPPILLIWLAATVVMTIFLHRTVPGRRLLATGANQRGANYALIRTRRVYTLAFVFSAIVSVFLGLAVLGFNGSVTTISGNPFLFQSVIVVILGGTIFGGPGDYLRTVIGALFVTVVSVVLVGHGASQADQQIIFGAALILALSLYGRQPRIRDRV